jgi:hypothetical protein
MSVRVRVPPSSSLSFLNSKDSALAVRSASMTSFKSSVYLSSCSQLVGMLITVN